MTLVDIYVLWLTPKTTPGISLDIENEPSCRDLNLAHYILPQCPFQMCLWLYSIPNISFSQSEWNYSYFGSWRSEGMKEDGIFCPVYRLLCGRLSPYTNSLTTNMNTSFSKLGLLEFISKTLRVLNIRDIWRHYSYYFPWSTSMFRPSTCRWFNGTWYWTYLPSIAIEARAKVLQSVSIDLEE